MRWWSRGRQGSDLSQTDPISREKERALKLFGDPPAEEPHPYAIDPVRPVTRPAAAAYVEPRAPVNWRMPIMAFGILLGGVLGLLLFVDDPKLLLEPPRKWLAEISGTTGYIDCGHARLVGAAPMKKGEKGYSKRLDVDGDGIACESILSDGEDAGEGAPADDAKGKESGKSSSKAARSKHKG
jgi:hypothetical protein